MPTQEQLEILERMRRESEPIIYQKLSRLHNRLEYDNYIHSHENELIKKWIDEDAEFRDLVDSDPKAKVYVDLVIRGTITDEKVYYCLCQCICLTYQYDESFELLRRYVDRTRLLQVVELFSDRFRYEWFHRENAIRWIQTHF